MYDFLLDFHCTISEIISLISQNLKRPHDTSHILLDGNISCLTGTPVYQSANAFEVPSFTISKDMIGA